VSVPKPAPNKGVQVDGGQRPLRSRYLPHLTPSVRQTPRRGQRCTDHRTKLTFEHTTQLLLQHTRSQA